MAGQAPGRCFQRLVRQNTEAQSSPLSLESRVVRAAVGNDDDVERGGSRGDRLEQCPDDGSSLRPIAAATDPDYRKGDSSGSTCRAGAGVSYGTEDLLQAVLK
jgi:hypothetical protein